jgi:hypothetical protein
MDSLVPPDGSMLGTDGTKKKAFFPKKTKRLTFHDQKHISQQPALINSNS